MIKKLKTFLIVLLYCIIFKSLTRAEDDDDIALAKINKILVRSPRMASIKNESATWKDSNKKRELESKLNELLEYRDKDSTKHLVARDFEENESTEVTVSENLPFERFDPENKRDNEEGKDESSGDDSENNEKKKTTKHPTRHKNKGAKFIDKIRQKITDKKTVFTVSLPMAIVIVGSIVLVTCCCALYVRNRLVACINIVTGQKKRNRKMMIVETERERTTPRSKKKSISSGKKRARSLSQDVTTVATQKSDTMDMTYDEPSTTGCYHCCKKKKKSEKRNKR